MSMQYWRGLPYVIKLFVLLYIIFYGSTEFLCNSMPLYCSKSQAYDAIYMDSVLKPEIIYFIEYFTVYTLPDTEGFVK